MPCISTCGEYEEAIEIEGKVFTMGVDLLGELPLASRLRFRRHRRRQMITRAAQLITPAATQVMITIVLTSLGVLLLSRLSKPKASLELSVALGEEGGAELGEVVLGVSAVGGCGMVAKNG